LKNQKFLTEIKIEALKKIKKLWKRSGKGRESQIFSRNDEQERKISPAKAKKKYCEPLKSRLTSGNSVRVIVSNRANLGKTSLFASVSAF